ncbi:hypothetical protein HZ326_10491 [Fusarium oxysporum f. sp. albedinis]|nr:hypothetical protein HZ326_10491 [Fusarium oxysporum f. sp. albedinis]
MKSLPPWYNIVVGPAVCHEKCLILPTAVSSGIAVLTVIFHGRTHLQWSLTTDSRDLVEAADQVKHRKNGGVQRPETW